MLFRLGHFKSASGLDLDWKIECDAFDQDDWSCIAKIGAEMAGSFFRASGVPRGGLQLAEAIAPYRDPNALPWLVVDDVWTTGLSMHRHVQSMGLREGQWKGFVVFARGISLPPWVQCLCKVNAV